MSGLRERDIVALGRCALCDGPLMAHGLPLFYCITVERFGIDLGAVSRQAGLGMLLGSAALASAMGPDEVMATPLFEAPVQMGVCEACAGEPNWVGSIINAAFERSTPGGAT